MLNKFLNDLIEERGLIEKLDKLDIDQDVKLIEEMSELTKEVCKMMNGKVDHVKLLDEFTDVLIVMNTFATKHNLTLSDIYDMMDSKLKRFDRIHGGKN